MDREDKILLAITASREASHEEHRQLADKVDKIDRKLYGEDDKEDGIVFKVNQHHKLLKFALWYMNVFKDKPVQGIILLVAIFHFFAYTSFKGLDALFKYLHVID